MDYLDEKCMDINYASIYGSTYELMKNAGKAISGFIISKFPEKKSIAIICGTGNNAGDGICAGGYLLKKYRVSVIFIKGPKSLKTPESRRAFNEYVGEYYTVSSLESIVAESDIIVDSIFGTGIKDEPREPYNNIIDIINKSGKSVISVDVPSGFPSSKRVKPDYTVTFTDIKTGMERENSGEIIVCDIGIPEMVKSNAGPGDMVYMPVSDPESHKGMNGITGILAGWEFTGAAVISSLAAYNTGPDLVKVFSSNENRQIILSHNPGLMFYPVNNQKFPDLSNLDSLLIGPGMGKSKEAIDLMEYAINNYNGQLIMDADALKVIDPSQIYGRNVIITPHRVEFTSFTGMEPIEKNAMEAAKKYKITVLLKGSTDIITDGSRIKYSHGGNSRMAMGGTGDALAGIVAGIASRKVNPFNSAVLASVINKKCGEMGYENYGYYYGIMDMIGYIKKIFNNKI
jgi:hydroxyethylthiazole kinase-like uncharacterized protein yjeF